VSRRAVVIGSGPNGLAAAIRLAENGFSVTVLEAAPYYGGAVRTEELTLPGFHHDVFSAVYPAGAASPVFERMPLAQHGLEWSQPHVAYAHPLPDGTSAGLYRSVEETARSLDQAGTPGDGEGWKNFAEPFLDKFDAIRHVMLGGFPPVGSGLKLLAALGPVKTAGFTRLVPGTAEGLGHRLFDSGNARAWLYSSAGHGDAAPGDLGSGIAVAYLNLLGHAVGWPSPVGGAGKLADALVGYLRSLGGEIRTSSRVVGVDTAGRGVTGVTIASGEKLPADVVCADVMPHALAWLAGDALPSTYRSMLLRYRYGPATVKVDWALDGPIPWQTEELRSAGTVHVGGSEQELGETIATSHFGLPERPFMLLGQQTVADPTRAPDGKHTAWAYTHGPRRGIDWRAEQDRHVERMEAHIESYAPGFRNRILARHIMGPAQLSARDESLVEGDVGGGTYRIRQVVFRPMPKISPYRTPVRGLYLGSAAAFPGGAVHGVPGDAAARAAVKDLG